MDKYHKLLKEKKDLEVNLKYKNKLIGELFREEHRRWLRVLDVLWVLILVFNICAGVITNALVFEKSPNEKLVEVNPEYAEVNNLEVPEPETAKKMMDNFMFFISKWWAVIGVYLLLRLSMDRRWLLYFTTLFTLYFLSITGLDFFNDLGFLLGKIVWGG